MTNKDRARYFLGRIIYACSGMLRRLDSVDADLSKAATTDIRIAYGQIQTAYGDLYLDAGGANRPKQDRAEGYESRNNETATIKKIAENVENDYYKGFSAND